MNKLQSNLFKMLKEIDSICKAGGVEYYLAGGTALGAVRNHCFLPWDDDIDLYITRDNWNKLRDYIENNDVVPEGRAFVYKENAPYYCNPIPRYVDLTTTSMMKSQVLSAKALGQNIELLIMDPMPLEENLKNRYVDMLKAYTELVSPYFIVNKKLSTKEFDKHYNIYNKFYHKSRIKGYEKVITEIESKLLRYAEEECEELCMRWGIDILRYKKKDFGKARLERFEDEYFPVGEHAEGIFRIAYGDSWMYVPESEGQIIHNPLYDLNSPFSIYTNLYEPIINKKKYYKAYCKNKRNNIKAFRYELKIDEVVTKAKGILANKELKKSFIVDKSYAERLLSQKKYDELNKLFGAYYSIQMDPKFRKHSVCLDIDDDLLYIAVLNYIEQGKYYIANRLLKLRETKGCLDNKLQMAKQYIGICRELSIAIYDLKDTDKVKRTIETLDDRGLDLIDVYRARLWLMRQNNDWEKMKLLAEKALNEYPFDGELIAYKGLALYKEGFLDEAKEAYAKAINMTRNAFVWEDAKEFIGFERIKNA